MVAGHHPGDRRAATAGRRVLAHERECRRQTAAEAEPGQETEGRELANALREAGRDCEERVHGDAGDKALAPTEPVGQRPDQDSANAHADQPQRGGRGDRGPGKTERPGLEEGRDDDAEDDEVVAVEGDRYPAEQDGPEVGRAGCAGGLRGPREMRGHRDSLLAENRVGTDCRVDPPSHRPADTSNMSFH